MGGRLRICVLGEFRVLRGDREVSLPPSKKTRALLAHLAVVGRPVRRERLCEMFWDRPDDPRGSLRWSLSKIRAVLNGDRDNGLEADRNTVFLRTEAIDLDLSRLAHLTVSDIETFDTDALEQAAAAFRGGFLEDLQLPRCPEFEAWRVSHSNELELLRLRILRRLVDRLRDEPERSLVHVNTLRTLDAEDPMLAREGESLAAAARQFARAEAPKPQVTTNARPDAASEPAGSAAEASTSDSGSDSLGLRPERQQVQFCTSNDGVRIAYSVSGQGPPLVRAAHWMSHLQYDWQSPVWHHWISELSRQYKLVRYDERGCGLSDWNVSDLSFEAMLADLESIVDAAGLHRFTLLGVSQSCAVSVAYAVRHPERVTGLVLYGGYVKGWRKRADSHEIATREALATLMREGWGQNNALFRQLFASRYIPGASPVQVAWFDELQRWTMSPENAWRLQNVFADIDVTSLLGQVTVPTLVVHARNDAVAPFEAGRAFATGVPRARFVELDSANHILLPNEPAFRQFLQEVRAFTSHVAEQARSSGPAEQRRVVSVLAAEIVNPNLEDDDPEVAMNALDPLLDLAAGVVERHSGTVVSRGQNDLTVVFGAAEPTEGHALQACRAALDLKQTVENRAKGAARVRAGLDAGEVIVRTRMLPLGPRIEVNGSPVRIARRLVQALRRDLVAATGRARDSAAGHVQMDRLAAAECPSFPGAVYDLVAEKTARLRWHLRSNPQLTPLIGRDGELQLLRHAAQRARAGSGQSVCLIGFPGIGKSRLVHEFLTSSAAAGLTVVEGGALELDANVGYALVKTLLRGAFNIDGADTPDVALGKVTGRLAELGVDRPIQSALHSPLLLALDLPVSDPEWALLSQPIAPGDCATP